MKEERKQYVLDFFDKFDDFVMTLSIPVSPSIQSLLKTIVKQSPAFILDILESVETICADGKIDLHDLPEFISIIFKAVQMWHYMENNRLFKKFSSVDVIELTRALAHIILFSEISPIKSRGTTEMIIRLIDVSLDLLSQTVIVRKSLRKFHLC